MSVLYRIIAASLMALIIHASLLATLPVVWCVSEHGHTALEPYFLGVHHRHHVPFAAKVSVEDPSTPLANHDDSTDCIDTAAIPVFSNVAETTQRFDLPPIFTRIPHLPSLPSATTPLSSASRPPAPEHTKTLPLAHLRSVILLI